MNTAVEFKVKIILELGRCSVDELEQLRSALGKRLSDAGVGYCGSGQLLATGTFEFTCRVSEFHNGLNIIREQCLAMSQKPKIRVDLYDSKEDMIHIYPDNDLTSYLSGLS